MRNLGDTATGSGEADPHGATAAPGVGEARILTYVEPALRRGTPGNTVAHSSVPPQHAAHGTREQIRPAASAPAREPAPRVTQRRVPPASAHVGRVAPPRDAAARVSKEILRFRTSERVLHWSIAVPFMICLGTGIVIKLFFNRLHPALSVHAVLQWVHRVSGAFLLIVPAWTALRHRKDLALYRYNIKRAWAWTWDDVKWLALIGPATFSKGVHLPDQHKFNAGEKLNFMTLMLTYPLLIATGVYILMPGMHFVAWVAHVGVAILSAPLIFGHIFMAVINPDTRVGLSGMFSGRVDREWAKHHYAKWYQETYGADEQAETAAATAETAVPRQAQVRVLCLSCGAETPLTSWALLLESISELRPLECPACGAPSAVVSGVVKVEEVVANLEAAVATRKRFEHTDGGGPCRIVSSVPRLPAPEHVAEELDAARSPFPDRA